MFYVISVLITLVTNKISNNVINKKFLDMGYICKNKKLTKGKLILNLLVDFIPYLNLLVSLFNIFTTIAIVNNEQLLLKFGEGLKHSPEYVKFKFERENVNEKLLSDVMTLEGATEDIIKEELNKIKKEEDGFAKKEKIGRYVTYLDDQPTFTKKDYDLACAQELAKQMLFEIECNKELNSKEKAKILSLFREAFLSDIKGNKKDTVKPVEKTLKMLKNK